MWKKIGMGCFINKEKLSLLWYKWCCKLMYKCIHLSRLDSGRMPCSLDKIAPSSRCFQSSQHVGQHDITHHAGSTRTALPHGWFPSQSYPLYTTPREMISRTWTFKLNGYFKAIYDSAKVILAHKDSLGPMRIWWVPMYWYFTTKKSCLSRLVINGA